MGKRCIVIFLALLFAFSGICARLAYLMVYKPIAVGSLSGNLVVEFSQNRGAVYDCNGERLVDEKKIKFAALTDFFGVRFRAIHSDHRTGLLPLSQ